MQKPDPYGEWALPGPEKGKDTGSSPAQEALLAAAREAWPHVLAHARRTLAGQGPDSENTALAAEVWEGLLRSVSKALHRRRSQQPIADLNAYLIGAFHHRFNRVLKRERRRTEIIELVPSIADLERMESARDIHWVVDLERAITIREIVDQMDDWTRRVWRARQLGYSWKEIAEHLGLNQPQAKMRFRYGLEKTRDRLFGVLRGRKSNPLRQK